jgi:hypothetical protein
VTAVRCLSALVVHRAHAATHLALVQFRAVALPALVQVSRDRTLALPALVQVAPRDRAAVLPVLVLVVLTFEPQFLPPLFQPFTSGVDRVCSSACVSPSRSADADRQAASLVDLRRLAFPCYLLVCGRPPFENYERQPPRFLSGALLPHARKSDDLTTTRRAAFLTLPAGRRWRRLISDIGLLLICGRARQERRP